ncbi:nuclear transport factor 2 family protein [Streptomyces sp. KMM 9044]|uniref:nuclear transport factor 2 family protein n=1 Tax=Streptomyces sp. KMM 9044 TaxID=2744474 RepID=UPI002151B5CA|nr:nuclear transport factor 2 family protein [Streptomyces sp. KMM 9044]WAX76366.1 nuclear transport factor 2 family protein [Streptomyces sp. KMM 9044]
MTSTDDESFAPGAAMADAFTVGGLLDRYLLALDSEKLDDVWARSLFTADAVVAFPLSQHEGIDGLSEWHRNSLAHFARTQHLNSPAVVDCAGDEATLRANLVSTHVHHPGGRGPELFTAGTSVSGAARRTPDGWRLTRLSFGLIWVDGEPPGARG